MRHLACVAFLLILTVSFAEVPEHEPSLDGNCPAGFQWSRGTIACEQADCPEGSGRTYTYECNCGEAWDKPFRTCYDPARPGFAVACVAAGSPCPGEKPPEPQCNFDRDCPHGQKCSNGQCQSVSSCIVDSDCPVDYTCTGGQCQSSTQCNSDSDCQTGYRCDLATYQCVNQEESHACTDVICALQGGRCENDVCVVQNRCENVTCDNICEGGIQKSDGDCLDLTGECEYSQEAPCKNGCSRFGKRCMISVGNVNFRDTDNATKPLKGVRVEAEWYNDLGMLLSRLPTRYSDEGGSVFFSDNELDAYENGTLSVTVVFEDESRRLQVVDASSLGATPTDAQRLAAPIANYTETVSVDEFATDFDINLTLDSGKAESKYAKIYYHGLEAVEFMEDEFLLFQKNAPERFYADDGSTTGAYHAGGVGPGAPDKGIMMSSVASRFSDPEAPTNREWHEFGHHIMYELYGYHYCCVTRNHAGYANPTSVDSYTEGFAEFMSMMMLDRYNYPKKNLYFVGATPYDMEMNYRVDSNSGGLTMEEMALASIYYDLLDGGANDEDGIQLSREQIWEVLSSTHTFGSEDRYIHSISDAYRAFNSSSLPGLHDKWGSTPFFVSRLDRIFITHGVYADRNGDRLWEPGEEVGYTLKDGTARAEGATRAEANRPVVPGSYIKLDVQDEQSGAAIAQYPIHVSVHVTGREEGESVSYDFDYDTVPDESGEININMPPAEYDTIMTFSLGGDDRYEQTKDAFSLTSKEFYERIDPLAHSLGAYSATLKPKTELPGCPCASAFLLLAIGLAVLRKQ
ncbi:MAG: hypothetical protein V1861_00515 [Candidatus Micrarchaeota archaeon]